MIRRQRGHAIRRLSQQRFAGFAGLAAVRLALDAHVFTGHDLFDLHFAGSHFVAKINIQRAGIQYTGFIFGMDVAQRQSPDRLFAVQLLCRIGGLTWLLCALDRRLFAVGIRSILEENIQRIAIQQHSPAPHGHGTGKCNQIAAVIKIGKFGIHSYRRCRSRVFLLSGSLFIFIAAYFAALTLLPTAQT